MYVQRCVLVGACVCVCVKGQRGNKGVREEEKEQWEAVRCPALKLPVCFQSLHQLH